MAVAVTLRVNYVDDKGKTSFTKARFETGFTIANYITAAQTLIQLMANLSNATITGASITFNLSLAGLGLPTVPSAAADIFQKAKYKFSSIVAGLAKTFNIPASSELIVIAGSDAINTADAGVAAFLTAVTDGTVTPGGTIAGVDKRGNDLDALQFANEYHTKHL